MNFAEAKSLSDRAQSSEALADEGMLYVPGGTFRMGSDRHYPEEAPSPSRHRGWVLDRPDAGHQPPIPRIRQRDRLRHFRRIDARGEGLSERVYRICSRPARWSSRRPRQAVDLRYWGEWWTFKFGANWRRPYGRAQQYPRARRPSGRSRRLPRRRSLCQMGRQGIADRGRMGVRRARRTWTTPNSPGATN